METMMMIAMKKMDHMLYRTSCCLHWDDNSSLQICLLSINHLHSVALRLSLRMKGVWFLPHCLKYVVDLEEYQWLHTNREQFSKYDIKSTKEQLQPKRWKTDFSCVKICQSSNMGMDCVDWLMRHCDIVMMVAFKVRFWYML